MFRRTLLVLMWKHLVERKRRWFQTLVDFIMPVMFICLMFHFRFYIIPPKPKHHETASADYDSKAQYPDVVIISKLLPPRRVLYYPSNTLTDTLMKEVGAKLELKPFNSLPNTETIYKGYYGAKNITEVSDYLTEIDRNEAFVIFENLVEQEWPSELSYSIRIKDLFYTNTFEQLYGDVPRPHRQFGEVYEAFLRLQWTIDTSYIKVVTNNDVRQTIAVQEFPYYGSEASDTAATVCAIIAALGYIATFLPFVFLTTRLLAERTSGIQELVKMVGVSPNTLAISHFLNVVPVGLFYTILTSVLVKHEPYPLVANSNGFLIFLILILHFSSTMCLSFACSYIANSTQYGTSIAVFAYLVTWLPSRLLGDLTPPRAVTPLTGIFPHVPLNWFWDEVAAFEKYNEGLSWGQIWSSNSATSGPVALAVIWLVVQIGLFSFLAWYLSLVRPGKFGSPLPLNFLCKKEFWSKNEVRPEVEEEEQFAKEDKFFEPPPKHVEIGIKCENISKVFPKQRALTNVNLDVYKGEITVLLGHNGAGKTTLMNIITGMMTPSEGRVLVNGVDATRQRDEVARMIGLCPQHNLSFPNLTVLEHAMFFTLLKHGTYKEAKRSCLELLEELGLSDKAETTSCQLSGGMRRRLQLACALAGGADVLVLDEPTSGLDVETRRALWDLLLSLRGSRSVLLSTHFMEEADALGDRVAALHQGTMRCFATTMHLKKAIGTGYRLSLTTTSAPHEGPISAAVQSHVPDASLTQKTVNSLVYNLPAANTNNFPKLFTSLEDKKSELGIESIGVGVSTLEEVFLKLCSDTDFSMTDDEIDSRYEEPQYNKVKGAHLYFRQFLVLLKRQANFFMSKKITFFLIQVLVPIVMICVFTHTCNNSKQDGDPHTKVATDLDIYRNKPNNKIMYNIDSKGADVGVLRNNYPDVTFRSSQDDIAEGVLRAGKSDIMEYNDYIAGIELNDTNAKILYTSLYRHAAPVAMNLLTNILATQYMPKANGRTFTTYNHPIAGAITLNNQLIEPKDWANIGLWAILIIAVILGCVINFVSLPCRERVSGSRHIHVMAGCPAALHWAATLVTHLAIVFATVVPTLVLAMALLERDATIDNSATIGCVVVVLAVGIPAFLASMYVVSFWVGEHGAGIILAACIVLFSVITPAVSVALSFSNSSKKTFKDYIISVISWIAPGHSLVAGLGQTLKVARLNAYCELNRDQCPNLYIPSDDFDPAACCDGGLPRCYFCWDDYAPTPEIVKLAVQFFVYMTLVILIQEGYICRLKEKILNSFYKKPNIPDTDDMVRAEKVFVEKENGLDTKQISEAGVAMLVHDVHKNYRKTFGLRSVNAVKGISFSVKSGECFGLLGVNGAGKSTTFKMLTMEECTTSGQIYGNGYRAEENRGQYLKTLGYCPQFFGLDDFQTARDNLTLLLTLRGLDREETTNEVKSWIAIVGLEKYASRKVWGYSGGMCRRLGAAAALAVGGRLTLLDEPTAGVDVAARRRVWAALRRAHAARAVLLTSHSMDEMEALCDRIAIMSGGKIRTLGSAHELRARHAAGHAVLLKLRHDHTQLQLQHGHDQVDSGKDIVNSLKTELGSKFDCTLKDEHKTMLHYHINETLHYSNLFTTMEALKKTYPILEDYSITETTLEEVFLSFAKEEQPSEQTVNKQRNNIV